MLSMLFGLVAMGLGIWGMRLFSVDFLHFIRGALPFSLFCAGFVGFLAGYSSRSDK